MVRNCIVLLLIAGLAASHLAVMPHAHEDATAEQQKQHDATPHFHLTWLGAPAHSHSHGGHHHDGHSHVHQGHSHHSHSHSGQVSESQSDAAQPTGNGISMPEHDADAVSTSVLALNTTRVESTMPPGWTFTAPLPSFLTLEDLVVVLQPSPRWHPPDKVQDDSEIYLTMQNLRI